MHHPWRAFRDLSDWTLYWAPLPHGIWGLTNFRAKTVTIRPDLNQAQRRCTIAHEVEHIRRGPVHKSMTAHEEVVVDRNAARRLIPDVKALGEALAWSPNLYVAADELWVDDLMLKARLESLHPAERAYLKRRLSDLDHP